MDVVLPTNDLDKSLGLYAVNRFADNSGYCAELRVASHGFAAQLQFCVEPARFRDFIEQIEAMNRLLRGEACLKPTYESNQIRLVAGRGGWIIVSGELQTLVDGEDHMIRFAFRTDQTCLSPLARDLRACMELAAV
jgi:hypothetical protein